jgi:hypothetical protein
VRDRFIVFVRFTLMRRAAGPHSSGETIPPTRSNDFRSLPEPFIVLLTEWVFYAIIK